MSAQPHIRPLPTPPDAPLPLPTNRPTLSPAQAAVTLGMARRTLHRRLSEAPQDGRGRVIDGEWRGCYRHGTRWRIPARVVAAHQAQQQHETGAANAAAGGFTPAQLALLNRRFAEERADLVERLVAAQAAWLREMGR